MSKEASMSSGNVVNDDDGDGTVLKEGGASYRPKVVLAIGEKRTVKGAAKDPYVQKRRVEGFYSCTCPSWRNLSLPEAQRSCAHLRALLGDEYEAVRVRLARLQVASSALGGFGKASSAKRKATSNANEDDDDVFPHAQSAAKLQVAKMARALPGDFNGRNNGGPRAFNGASPLLLAHTWPKQRDPTGYWLSEKLDGVRAWWNGERMFARSGRSWNPPAAFREKLPKDMALDGELWMRRDAFDKTSGICRGSNAEGWKAINFMVFDVTNKPMLYEERLRELKRRLPDGERTPDEVQEARSGGLVCVLPAVQCRSREHFDTLMRQVLEKGGEGLMLREPRSAYEVGRSKTLYKHKEWNHAEAIVIGHEWGEGRNKGRMGAIKVRMECGLTLSIGGGLSDAQRQAWQPIVGTIVRYHFQELSHDGTPRFPSYDGTCPDKTKPRDAIVRSTARRAAAHAEGLKRHLDSAVAANEDDAEGDDGRSRSHTPLASSSRTASPSS